MRLHQKTSILVYILWISISLPSLSVIATSPDSSLRAGDIDRSTSKSVSDFSKPTTTKTTRRKKIAVIVGGGPGGLAAALVLSNVKKLGMTNTGFFFERIIVLDEASKGSYDPTRAYSFNINQRGQRFIDAFDIDLSKRGSHHKGFEVQMVPSDLNDVFDGKPPATKPMNEEERQNRRTSYSIQRHELVKLITDEIYAKNKENKKTGKAVIEIRRGTSCEYIESTEDGLVKIVVTRNKVFENRDKSDFIIADFCVGADGVSSNVRQSLEDGRFDSQKWSNANNPSKKFGLKQYTTPSTGLRIKALRIDPNFAIPKGGTGSDRNSEVPIETRYVMYRLESAIKGPTDSLPLSILPQKDPHSMSARIVNMVTEPSHDLWNPAKIRTDDGGRSAKEYFVRAHPRYDWDKLVSKEEWEVFASTKGSTFPPCQYAPSMYVSCSNNGDDGGAGVVLLGDALHAFPPDLGQGVNAAFCDALLLGNSFEEAVDAPPPSTNNSFVSKALESYQEKNGPETRALVALARCGAPFQYRQASRILKFQKIFWVANFLLRILLNKITLGFSPKPAMMMMAVRTTTTECC